PQPAPPNFQGTGTIQPSTFQAWENRDPLPSPRRTSISSVQSPLLSQMKENRYDTPLISPVSEQSYGYGEQRNPSESEEEVDRHQVQGRAGPLDRTLFQGGQVFVTDSETKQTLEIRRMCYNCSAKEPPSWRRSILNAGKILCNKCGIFEKTHKIPRPTQAEEGKLRKVHRPLAMPAPGQGLQRMDDGDGSEGSMPNSPCRCLSPRSRAPSSPQSLVDSTVPSQGPPSATLPLFSFSARYDPNGYPAPPAADPNPAPTYHSHAHANSHASSSPYHHAYNNRRNYSASGTAPLFSPYGSGYAHHQPQRRHSDAQAHFGV
ncbi:hypothetical protein P7C73_g6782, partial [Tremellales sp. Uapishka_1]